MERSAVTAPQWASRLSVAPRVAWLRLGSGPGSIATEMAQAVLSDPEKARGALMRTPLGRFGEPEEVASAVLYLASREAAYITGAVLEVTGGL